MVTQGPKVPKAPADPKHKPAIQRDGTASTVLLNRLKLTAVVMPKVLFAATVFLLATGRSQRHLEGVCHSAVYSG